MQPQLVRISAGLVPTGTILITRIQRKMSMDNDLCTILCNDTIDCYKS